MDIYLYCHFNGQKPILNIRKTTNKQKTRQIILKKNKKKAKLKDILQVSISTNFQVNKSWFEK